MGRLGRQKRLLMEEANKVLLGESYEGIIKQGDKSCEIQCKRKIAKDGSSGDVVKMIQHYLAQGTPSLGPYNSENSGGGMSEACAREWGSCDGKFRSETKRAVMEFQKDAGIKADGVVGAETLKKICELLGDDHDPYKSLCSDCACDDKTQDNDEDVQVGDEGFDQLIETVDCDKIKYCIKKLLSNSEGTTDQLIRCIKGKSGDKKTYGKYDCKTDCPKYINRMPGPGKRSEMSEKDKWCIKNCGTEVAV